MTSPKELFSAECQFIAGAASSEQIPKYFIPEVAFAGRSNVGKSSLINALVGRKDCARVSKFPGRTQQINFFSLQNKISLVDLPGYGYAAISKKMRKAWDDLILNYLIGRQNLRRVFLLIDSRHGIKKNDEEIMNILDDCAVVYQIILTKVDEISNPDVDKVMAELATHTAAHPSIIATSSEKNIGIQAVRAEIASFT
ncbi:MAG: ribosome biogenesis GTP-binding protein YihA/YsxC [Holosporaceae bacterium]|jgi:GTP-binding protein|nr:ribosome biogenesis GTP-binding protein YihA/YsxC [Holosporaceae bacterium]